MFKHTSIVTRQTIQIQGTFNPTLDIGVVLCNTAESPSNIILPNIESSTADKIGYEIVIQDEAGNASQNNITITASSGESINGQQSIVIKTNGGAVKLEPFANKYWVAYPLGSGGGSVPLPSNPLFFYLDGNVSAGGDGSIENPFKTITELNDAILLLNPLYNYTANVEPFEVGYGFEVSGDLNLAPNLSLVGTSSQNTSVVCNVKVTATALNIKSQFRNISFNGVFTLDLTLAPLANIFFTNGVFNLNRIDSNLNGIVYVQGALGASIINGGKNIVYDSTISGLININAGAQVYCTDIFLAGGTFSLAGNCNLKTLSVLNPADFYVTGTVNVSGKPIWSSDLASNKSYQGTLTNLLLNDIEMPLWGQRSQYLLYEDFDKGIIPSGWASSTSGGTIVYTQQYETFAIGQALITANRGAAATRAGLLYGSNYLLRLDDCVFTKWFAQVRRAPTEVGMVQYGFANSVAVAPNGFGNTIAVMHDPNNMSGKNPTLISNWIFVTNRVGFSFNAIDTGVAPNSTWQYFEAEFNNSTGSPVLTLKVNGVVTNTITTMTNVPVVLNSGQSFAPHCYAGSTIGAVGTNSIRIDKFSVFRKWN